MNLYYVEATEMAPWHVPGGLIMPVEASRYVIAENEESARVVRWQWPDGLFADLSKDPSWLPLLHPYLVGEGVDGPERVLYECVKEDNEIIRQFPTRKEGWFCHMGDLMIRNGEIVTIHE